MPMAILVLPPVAPLHPALEELLLLYSHMALTRGGSNQRLFAFTRAPL